MEFPIGALNNEILSGVSIGEAALAIVAIIIILNIMNRIRRARMH